MSAIQKHVLFHGRVQGVGFRFTARECAAPFAVTGFVRNLPDGSVELVAEGENDEIDRFLDAVRSRMSGNIAREDVRELPHSGKFPSFEITYSF